jgi:hypothetical protein
MDFMKIDVENGNYSLRSGSANRLRNIIKIYYRLYRN